MVLNRRQAAQPTMYLQLTEMVMGRLTQHRNLRCHFAPTKTQHQHTSNAPLVNFSTNAFSTLLRNYFVCYFNNIMFSSIITWDKDFCDVSISVFIAASFQVAVSGVSVGTGRCYRKGLKFKR